MSTSAILTYYLLMVLVTFSIWLRTFLEDRTTHKTHRLSWIVLFVAPFFWPLILPLSYAELVKKTSRRPSVYLR